MNSNLPKFVLNFLLPSVGRTSKFVSMVVKSYFAAQNISLSKEQLIVLLCLEEECKSQSSLAFITERNKGSLTRLIQSLEKKGFVKRKTDCNDNRVNLVELTSNGRLILDNTKPVLQSMFDQLQQGIDEEEMKIARKVLQKVQENAQKELERIEVK